MKKVMVFGTFNIFHRGHESFLKQATVMGNYLIAVIARDETVSKIKNYNPIPEKSRLAAVKNSGLANLVILGDLKDKHAVIRIHRPDIICLGYDQKYFIAELENKLREFNLSDTKVIRLMAFHPEIYKSSKLCS